MALSFGPNLGLLVDGAIGESHYGALMKFFRLTDSLIQLHVKSSQLTTPPASPANGDTYIVPTGASGVWSSNIGKIARYSTVKTAWEYATPQEGWFAHDDAQDLFLKFNGSSWTIYAPVKGFNVLADYVDDSAASAGGIPVGGLYRTGSVVKVRVA